MRILLTILVSLVLISCGTFSKMEIPNISPKTVRIDSEVYQPCAKLQEDIEIKTFEDSLVAYGELATQYGICAKRQNNSIKIIKEFAGAPK